MRGHLLHGNRLRSSARTRSVAGGAAIAVLGCALALSVSCGGNRPPVSVGPQFPAGTAVTQGQTGEKTGGRGERTAGTFVPVPLLLSDLQQLAESASIPWRGPGAEWTIRWHAFAAAAGDLLTPGDARSVYQFEVVNERSVPEEAAVRERHPEISSDHLIVVATDAGGQPLLWRAILDPRIVRTEGPSPTGEMTGRVFHRAEAELVIALPLDRSIAELQIFQPRFTGTDWVLTRLGSVRPPQKS